VHPPFTVARERRDLSGFFEELLFFVAYFSSPLILFLDEVDPSRMVELVPPGGS